MKVIQGEGWWAGGAVVYLREGGSEIEQTFCFRLQHNLKITSFFFREREFKFLIATEAYEVGVHNDHVKNVCRIGTPRNLLVLLQEFGRAGRLGDLAMVCQICAQCPFYLVCLFVERYDYVILHTIWFT